MIIHRRNLVLLGSLALLIVATMGCRTAPPSVRSSDQPVRIALLSDLHVTRGTNESQPMHGPRLARAVAQVNQAGVDLVLMAGDLTEGGTEEEWSDFRRQIWAFNAPAWFVPGNHDVGNKRLTGAPGEVTFGRVVDYELKFGRSYYVREQAGVRVVGVNSALFQSGLVHENRMWRMLERALAKPSPLPTLLLTHHPLFVDQPDEKGGGYWNVEPDSRKRLMTLLRRGGVQAVLSGHLHRPVVHREDGILFYTTSPVAFGLPRDKQPVGWSLLTVTKGETQFEFQKITEE